MRGEPVVIIGGGLAGLTAGRVLKAAGTDYVVLESGDRPGGLCRTEVVDGYSFDYTGHLLHLKEGKSKDLIMDLMSDRLNEHVRRASIYVKGSFVDYPIQAHFGQLPDPLSGRCLEEFLKAAQEEVPAGLTFDQWAEKRFGKTLAGLFMIPYNSKLYCHPLEEMEVSWTSWSVPVPAREEIERIGRGEAPPSYGYNATFYYPREGGIEALPSCLAGGQEEFIRTDARVVHIDAAARRVTLHSGEDLTYGDLISTIPLPKLLGLTEGLPRGTSDAAPKLRQSSVMGICLGLTGPILRPDHWIYFPDRSLPFYRIGFPSNFSEGVTPAGCGSVYAEVAYTGNMAPETEVLAGRVLETLVEKGLVGPTTGIAAWAGLEIPCAYVFHDLYRSRNLGAIHKTLQGVGIRSVGRYGAWEYSGMQDAVDWGLKAALGVLQ